MSMLDLCVSASMFPLSDSMIIYAYVYTVRSVNIQCPI